MSTEIRTTWIMNIQEMIDKADSEPKKIVGNFLLKRLETDEDARKNWDRFSKTLEGCWGYIRNKARVSAVNGCCCVSDDTVFQWALEYLMDVKTYNVDGNIVTGTVTAGADAERWKAREINNTEEASTSKPTGYYRPTLAPKSIVEHNKPKVFTSKPKKKDDTDCEQLTLF